MQDQTAITEHRIRESWKLEAVDQSLPSVIRPATVIRVINKLYFIVELDDLTMTSEDRRPGNQLCCHAGSLNIFPVGWCSANNIHLTPVPGRFSSFFFAGRTFGKILFFLCIFVHSWRYCDTQSS